MLKELKLAGNAQVETYAKRVSGMVAGSWDRGQDAQAKITEYMKRLAVPAELSDEVRKLATKALTKQGIY